MIRLCQKKCGTPIKAILIGVNSGKPEDFRVLSDKPIRTLYRFRTVCLHCMQRCIYIYITQYNLAGDICRVKPLGGDPLLPNVGSTLR